MRLQWRQSGSLLGLGASSISLLSFLGRWCDGVQKVLNLHAAHNENWWLSSVILVPCSGDGVTDAGWYDAKHSEV